jgi:hypothetical protein
MLSVICLAMNNATRKLINKKIGFQNPEKAMEILSAAEGMYFDSSKSKNFEKTVLVTAL